MYVEGVDMSNASESVSIAVSENAALMLDYLSFYLTYKAVPVADIPA